VDTELRDLIYSINALKTKLSIKQSQLQVMRERCSHSWEELKGVAEDGSVLFADEICTICGKTRSK
jgi:hypothetical protein